MRHAVRIVDNVLHFRFRGWRGYCRFVAEEDSGTVVPLAASLPDRIALDVLTRLITRELVEDVLASTGRREQRKRLLPARVVVYFVLALALFYGDSYEEVMRKLVQGFPGSRSGGKNGTSRLPRRWPRRGSGWAPTRRGSCSSGSPSRARSCRRPGRAWRGGG